MILSRELIRFSSVTYVEALTFVKCVIRIDQVLKYIYKCEIRNLLCSTNNCFVSVLFCY